MTRRLPPLNALRAFEAAARHLSFKNAAEELHITPAAISQQVRALEGHVGRPLFRRITRGLYQCSACRTQTSPIAGTIFAATKLKLRVWFRAIYHLTQTKQGISSIELGRRLGVTLVIGSTSVTSTSFNCSMKPRIVLNSCASPGSAASSSVRTSAR